MPVVMPNVLISTSRPNFTASTGTSAPSEYLSEIEAHAGPITQQDYRALPDAAMESQYLIKVEVGTDIVTGDQITQVTLNNPPVYTPWDALGGNETLWVIFARDSAAGPLQHRQLYCKRETGGGPAQ
jgi:hypothetical protein